MTNRYYLILFNKIKNTQKWAADHQLKKKYNPKEKALLKLQN